MNISNYIHDLLVENECVIIPELGGFVANHNPASITGDNQVHFSPPAMQIVFNAKLDHNDGFLAEYIAEQNGITYTQGREHIADFVRQVNKDLQIYNKATIEHIGVLTINTDKVLMFETGVEENLLTDSFGLPDFVVHQLQSNIRSRHQPVFRNKESVRRLAVKKYAKRVAIIAPIILLIALLPMKYMSHVQESSLKLWDSLLSKKVLFEEAKPNTKSVKKLASFTTTPVKNKETATENVYHIIAGTFRNGQSACNITNDFIANGYKASVVQQNDLFKVSIQKFDNYEDAKAFLEAFRQSHPQHADAWLMVAHK